MMAMLTGEQMQGLVDLMPKAETPPALPNQGGTFDMETWIRDHNLPVVQTKEWNGARMWILNPCPFDPAHTNQSAWVLQQANGAIGAGCHHNGCQGKGWHDLRDIMEPGWRDKKEKKQHTPGSTKEPEKKPPKKSDILISCAASAELFKDDNEDAFAAVIVDGHREIHPIETRAFRRWLSFQYYQMTGEAPGRDAVSESLETISAQAIFAGKQYRLYLRVARHDGAIWYDLADPACRAVKVTADGWEIVDKPPIIFRRYQNTAPQLEPRRPGDLARLDKYLNLDDNDKLLFKVEAISTMIPGIPHVVPTVAAEKGAGKSTQQRIRRRLIDPARQELAALPQDKGELALMLAHNYGAAFDNLGGLQAWQSDMLCTASTGGGISKRRLYTDSDEVFLNFQHCPALNGINVVATAPDLLDRAMMLHMERIDDNKRMREADFWESFESDRPYILGGMLDALAGALRLYPTVNLKALPRMADFATWGYAIAEAAGLGGNKFLTAYAGNRKAANSEAISGNPVAAAMQAFFEKRTWEKWENTPAALLECLEKVAATEHIDIHGKGWPKSANSLSRKLNSLKSNLLDAGIKIDKDKSGDRKIIVAPIDTKNTAQTAQTAQDLAGQATQAGRYVDDIRSSHSNTAQSALGLDDIEDTASNTAQISSTIEPMQDKRLGDMDDMDGISDTSCGKVVGYELDLNSM